MKRPSKGTNQPGKSAVGAVETTTAHKMLGRPVTSAGKRKRHSDWGGASSVLGPLLGKMRQSAPEFCLPAAKLRCSIRLAYQAADASHPKRGELARREQGTLAARFIFTIGLQAVEVPIGRASPEEGTGRTLTILTIGWSSLTAPA